LSGKYCSGLECVLSVSVRIFVEIKREVRKMGDDALTVFDRPREALNVRRSEEATDANAPDATRWEVRGWPNDD
jgi:hypothetical protein